MNTKQLTFTPGTGDKILANWSLFRYQADEELSKDNFYAYKVSFGRQSGFMNYTIENDIVSDANLDVGFPRPLGSNNDSSLLLVANRLHNKLNRELGDEKIDDAKDEN